MVASWLNHKTLQITRGVGKTPGDPYSAEPDPIVVNLLGGAITLDPRGWSPEIAPVKNGGVWVDSPLSDGRQLLAAPVANVTEKIVVIVKDSTYLGIQHQMSSLNLMVNSCRDYWQSETQIDPVYLTWQATCAPGPQFALISNIDIDTEYEDSDTPTLRVTLAIEREPYWRGIPPGANPKSWTYYSLGIAQQFNYGNASLVTGTDHLKYQALFNKHEWVSTAYGLQVTPLTQNYIDITADQVPGDAPALVEIGASLDGINFASLYIGHSTKPYKGTGHDNVLRAVALNLAGGDGNTTGVGTKNTGAAGLRSNGTSAAVYTRVNRSVTGIDANYVTLSQWGGAAGASGIKLDRHLYRGTYAVFFRGFNNSTTPVITDMKLRVLVEEFEDSAGSQLIASQYTSEANPQISQPGLTYLGTITMPFGSRGVQSPLGYGVQLQEANSNLRISLQQQVLVATANRSIEFYDLCLLPIDEGLAEVAAPYSGAVGSTATLVFDNTGYLARGETDQLCNAYATNANSGGTSQEIRGDNIMLTPRQAQRLYFLYTYYISASVISCNQENTTTIRLNIVPRWSGMRDV